MSTPEATPPREPATSAPREKPAATPLLPPAAAPPPDEATPEAAALPRLKITPSKNQKQRSKLKQQSEEAAPAPAPEPPPPPPPATPADSPAGPLLRERRLKRSGHFELRPNQFATNQDAPPEETEY